MTVLATTEEELTRQDMLVIFDVCDRIIDEMESGHVQQNLEKLADMVEPVFKATQQGIDEILKAYVAFIKSGRKKNAMTKKLMEQSGRKIFTSIQRFAEKGDALTADLPIEDDMEFEVTQTPYTPGPTRQKLFKIAKRLGKKAGGLIILLINDIAARIINLAVSLSKQVGVDVDMTIANRQHRARKENIREPELLESLLPNKSRGIDI